MPFILLSILIQLFLILHVLKCSRQQRWIWIIVFIPIFGSLAYISIKIFPKWKYPALSTGNSHLSERLNYELAYQLSKAATDYYYADTLENTKNLARQCLYQEMYETAKHLFQQALKGIYKSEPDIMYGLAQSEYGLKNFGECQNILDSLIAENPSYRNQDAHLLYAKTLEKLRRFKQAIKEYEVLESYYCGPEPSYRLAMLFKQSGQEQQATQRLKKIIQHAQASGAHYYQLHKNWINLAHNALQMG